jgi:hypothetical protein
LQNQYLSEAEQYNNPAYAQQQAGTAVGNVDTAFTGARKNEQQQLNTYGADPGTARAGAINANMGSTEAAAKAAAGTASTQNTRLTGLNLQSNAENMMAGLPGQSTQEYGGANSSGNTASGNALGLTSTGFSTMGTGTQYSGLAQSSLANWGNTLSSSYNAQLGQFEANQQASSGLGSIFGTVAGMGTALAIGDGYARGGAIEPQHLAHGGMAIPDNLSYARGGPIIPRGAGKVGGFHAPHISMKLFQPHLMNNVHPHTASSHGGVGAGGNPRASTGMSMRGMGATDASGLPVAPGATRTGGVPNSIDSKSGGLPTSGGGGYGGNSGGGMALAEGGAIPASNADPYGRADNIPVKTQAGAYVIPKSVVDKKGTHHFDKIIAEHGTPQEKQDAHLRLMGVHPTMDTQAGPGSTHIMMSSGEYMMPKSVVSKLGAHHFDKIVAKEGDHTDRAAAEARLAGQQAGAGNGPPIPANQLRGAVPRVSLKEAIPMGSA